LAKLFTIRKYMGDDEYSWAVFDSRSNRPVCTGCSRREAQFHAKQLEEKYNAAR
jgi:hypothetical protein